jgi:hypothetical protein
MLHEVYLELEINSDMVKPKSSEFGGLYNSDRRQTEPASGPV